ncbi:serine hydrolase [Pedobacter steynii]|uniref:serine hydrolase n=1 Tax=Pedobacter steynii TaxID=430522 RepID=UPI0009F38F8A|nr:serine hydrolase [Pedobacter steynii]
MKNNVIKYLLHISGILLFLAGTPVLLLAQEEGVDSFIRQEMKTKRIPGLQLAVVSKGKIVLLKSYGIGNIQDSIPVDNQNIFAINSCTKAFTGIAMMQLVEDGKIDLNAPVSLYLDSLPVNWKPIKVRQLLTHVSGLPNLLQLLNPATNGLTGFANEEALWAKVKTMPMEFNTGEQFSYNQTNYALLGKIIDKISAKPFEQVFSERQFKAADMKRTVFADSRDVIPHMTPTYKYVSFIDGQRLNEDKLISNYAEFPAFRRTASGLNSTAEDIANWLIALQNGKLLKTKDAINRLWTTGTYNNGNPTQWALGWVAKPRQKHRAVIATGGGRSAFFVYPDDDLAIVVLTNLAGAYPEDFIDEVAGFYNPDIPAYDPISALRMKLREKGFENAIGVYHELKKKNTGFNPSEVDLNDWAYRMLSNKQTKEAVKIFKLATELYPNSWNAYDSYGEALLKYGQKQEAIVMYQKSLILNPNNGGGKRALERLMKQN